MATEEKHYQRFSYSDRFEHWVMSISFTILTITGLPQRYAQSDWAETMIEWMGGIELVRVFHRFAAVVFMIIMIYHFIAVGYKLFVWGSRWTMLPTLQDAKDLINSIRYYLDFIPDPPKLPRYNFAEKIEYWAVIWGGVLMAVTGFMLWNPVATTELLPGEFIPAARTAHSAEALLAFLAILIWHVYWVHIKTFNRAMFNGWMTHEQMEEEHMAELEEIESGQTPSPPPAEVVQHRKHYFLPVAFVITIILLVGLHFFVTVEVTAITTIPPAETVEAFMPATPTVTPTPHPSPTPTATPSQGEEIAVISPQISSHPMEEFEECQVCHAPDAPAPYPEDHQEYGGEYCLFCHSFEEDTLGPAPIQHSLVERYECKLCHEEDLLSPKHQEADFSNRRCLMCHLPGN